jgi:hypothetical protein
MDARQAVCGEQERGMSGPKCLWLAVLAAFSAASSATAAEKYYVAPNGDDSNAGSEAQPFKTLAKSLKVLKPGDTLLMRAGRYPAFEVRDLRGARDAPITIKGYPGEKVVIDRYPAGGVFTVHLIGICRHLVFEDFEVTDSDPKIDLLRKLNVEDPKDLETLRDFLKEQEKDEKCRFRDGVRINPPAVPPTGDRKHSYLVFRRLTVHHLLGLGFTGIGDHIEFIDNHVYDLGYPRSGYGWYTSGNDHVYRGNRVHDCPYGLHIYGTAVSRAVIENNVIYSNGRPFYHMSSKKVHPGGSGILLWAEGGDNVVRNNVLWDNCTGLNIDSAGAMVANNTVVGGKKGIVVFPNKKVTVRNNIAFACSEKPDAVEEGNTSDHNLFGVDPRFVDPEKRDFHLREGSPAIDAGEAIPGFAKDIDSNDRPQARAWDIGACEYIVGPDRK